MHVDIRCWQSVFLVNCRSGRIMEVSWHQLIWMTMDWRIFYLLELPCTSTEGGRKAEFTSTPSTHRWQHPTQHQTILVLRKTAPFTVYAACSLTHGKSTAPQKNKVYIFCYLSGEFAGCVEYEVKRSCIELPSRAARKNKHTARAVRHLKIEPVPVNQEPQSTAQRR